MSTEQQVVGFVAVQPLIRQNLYGYFVSEIILFQFCLTPQKTAFLLRSAEKC